jgi:hypothetical protein
MAAATTQPLWWWVFCLAVSLAVTVGEIQVLREKIEEPGWRFFDTKTRPQQIGMVALAVAGNLFCVFGVLLAL